EAPLLSAFIAEHLNQLAEQSCLPSQPPVNLSSAVSSSSILPTTSQPDGIDTSHLDEEAGATLLLRRAAILEADQELSALNATIQAEAKAVSRELHGLSLALEQAGAYMQGRELSPAPYLKSYWEHRKNIPLYTTDPDFSAVAVTSLLALDQVQ